MPRVLTAVPLRRTILLIVMAALLLTQALGLLHRVAHAPRVAPGGWGELAAHGAQAMQALNPRHTGHTGHAGHGGPIANVAAHGADHDHWLDRLFGGHDNERCALYDLQAHADFLWGAPVELCTAAVTVVQRSSNPAWRLAAQAAGYLARGPPRLA